MPKLWINALDNYAKNNGFKNRAEVIRSLFYPAFLEELKLLNPNRIIEPIIEPKKITKRTSIPRKIKRFKRALKVAIKNIETVREDKPKRISAFRDFIVEKPKPKKEIHIIKNETEFIRDLGYRKRRRKKEWKVSVPRSKHLLRNRNLCASNVSVPRRAMERSSIIHRRLLR